MNINLVSFTFITYFGIMRKVFVLSMAVLLCSITIAQEKVQDIVNTLPELAGVYKTGLMEDWFQPSVKWHLRQDAVSI